MSSQAAEDARFEALVASAAAGDEEAWRELWGLLEPRLSAVLRSIPGISRLTRNEDELRDVLVAVMGRLRQDRFHRLRLYLEARRSHPEIGFMRWLIVVAKRVAVDCIRAHPDYVDRRRSAAAAHDTPGVWIETEELPIDDSLSTGRPQMTNRVTVSQILSYAGSALPDQQRAALELWVAHRSNEEIAAALGLASADEAERLLRAAVERLRRHFRKGA